jgi:potassium/chloride transporter 9
MSTFSVIICHTSSILTNLPQTNISGIIILLGELATSLFSVLMGVIGSAKLLQALARDHLIPGLSIFGQGTKKADEPIFAVCITYMIAQVTMFADINQIASFITMTVSISLYRLSLPNNWRKALFSSL